MDCKLRYTADMPHHAHGAALCCCWLLGCGRVAALYDNSCLFVARSQISVSAVITTPQLLANHINLASHKQVITDLIGAGSTCKTKKIRLKVQNLPLPLGPVPQNVPSYHTSYNVLALTKTNYFPVRGCNLARTIEHLHCFFANCS